LKAKLQKEKSREKVSRKSFQKMEKNAGEWRLPATTYLPPQPRELAVADAAPSVELAEAVAAPSLDVDVAGWEVARRGPGQTSLMAIAFTLGSTKLASASSRNSSVRTTGYCASLRVDLEEKIE
jgi:hypothetical protein